MKVKVEDLDLDLEMLAKIKNENFKEQKRSIDEKFPQKKFPGKYPVRTLKYNLLERFNHFSNAAESLLSNLSSFNLNDKIKWSINGEEFISPRCVFHEDESSQIQISEKYFSYLWCASYCFFLHYEYLAQSNPELHIDEKLLITKPMLKRSQKIFNWSRSLLFTSDNWDITLPNPNPNSRMIDSESIYCLYTNHLSINALTFVLYHEVAHSYHKKETDPNYLKRAERDADNFAIDLMKEPKGKITVTSSHLGIIVALCSNLFLYNSPPKLSGETHPDPDIRILDAFERIAEKNDPTYKEYLHFIAIIFRMFSQTYGIESQESLQNQKEFKTIEEAISYFENLFEKFKEQNSIEK